MGRRGDPKQLRSSVTKSGGHNFVFPKSEKQSKKKKVTKA